MSKHQTFSVDVPVGDKEAMDKFQDAMNEIQDAYVVEQKRIAEEFDVSMVCAVNIWYLRTRSRWTEELENELIRRDTADEPAPNMCEYPEK